MPTKWCCCFGLSLCLPVWQDYSKWVCILRQSMALCGSDYVFNSVWINPFCYVCLFSRSFALCSTLVVVCGVPNVSLRGKLQTDLWRTNYDMSTFITWLKDVSLITFVLFNCLFLNIINADTDRLTNNQYWLISAHWYMYLKFIQIHISFWIWCFRQIIKNEIFTPDCMAPGLTTAAFNAFGQQCGGRKCATTGWRQRKRRQLRMTEGLNTHRNNMEKTKTRVYWNQSGHQRIEWESP